MSCPDRTATERQRRWYWNHKEQKNALTRARYESLKASGPCVICGSRPPVSGIVRCEGCQAKKQLRGLLRGKA